MQPVGSLVYAIVFFYLMIFSSFAFADPGNGTSALLTVTTIQPRDRNWFFPENWETRREEQNMILAPLGYGPNGLWKGYFRQKYFPATVYYWLELNNQSFFYFFSFEDSSEEQKIYKKGTISIKRSIKDGAFQSMTIILEDMPKSNIKNRSFVRLYPERQKNTVLPGKDEKRPELNERAVLELTFHGQLLYRQQVLPVTFEKALTMSFSGLRELTAKTIDWDLLLSPGRKDLTINTLVSEIRKYLDLTFEDDAAFDEAGKPVHIENLTPAGGGVNCSGFVKWVMDGLYYPFKGHYMSVSALKEKLLAIRGDRWSTKYEDVADPFFGLDWSRNLVCQLEEARFGQKIGNKEQFDVREIDFFNYKEDVGFKAGDLGLILYLLAKKQPGYFYIGSFNHAYRKQPGLRQHTHLALFFPYFIEEDQYRLVVMESGSETSLANAIRRFEDEYVHLVAVNAQGPLQLLPIKK